MLNTPRQLTLIYAACQCLSACLDIGALIASAVAAFGDAGGGRTGDVCKRGSGNQEICRFPVWSLSVAIVGHLGMLAYSAVAVQGPVSATQTTAAVLIGGGCLAAELAPAIIISSSFSSAEAGWRPAAALMYTASVISLAQLLLLAASRKLFKKPSKTTNSHLSTKTPVSTVDSRVTASDQGGFAGSTMRKSFFTRLASLGRRKQSEKQERPDSDQYPRPYSSANPDDASPYAVSNVFGVREQQMNPVAAPQQQYLSHDNYQQPYYGTVSTSNEAAANNKGFTSDEGGGEKTEQLKSQAAWPYSTTEI